MTQRKNSPADIGTMICEGDFVVDPLDNEIREVESFTDHEDGTATIHMVDGGIMGINETGDKNVFVDYAEAEEFAEGEE